MMLNLLSNLKAPIQNYLATTEDMVAPSSIHGLLAANSSAPLLIVTSSTRTSQELTAEICSLIGSQNVVNFLAWETLPHERLSPKADTVTLRFKALNQIVNKDVKIITCSIRALLQPIIANNLEASQIKIHSNQQISMTGLIKQLSQFGFTRSDLVERRGDFAVRGGILDLFPADQEHPIRIDYFGDEIEEISYFAVADQRSLTKITSEIIIYPCRELLLDEKVKENAKKLGQDFPEISEMTEKIIQGITFEGMESLAAGLVKDFKTIIDYLPKQTQIWFIDEPRLRSRATDLITTNEEFLAASWSNMAWSENEKLTPPLDLTAQLGVGGFNELAKIEQIARSAGLLIRDFESLSKYARAGRN
jgi:transcription-repair coupling factor (superfamily II helicase)